MLADLVLIRTHFLVCRWPSSSCFTTQKSREGKSKLSSVSSYKGTNTIHEGLYLHDPINPQKPHNLISSHWESGFQHKNFGMDIFSLEQIMRIRLQRGGHNEMRIWRNWGEDNSLLHLVGM